MSPRGRLQIGVKWCGNPRESVSLDSLVALFSFCRTSSAKLNLACGIYVKHWSLSTVAWSVHEPCFGLEQFCPDSATGPPIIRDYENANQSIVRRVTNVYHRVPEGQCGNGKLVKREALLHSVGSGWGETPSSPGMARQSHAPPEGSHSI
jgi:hypothetical protein